MKATINGMEVEGSYQEILNMMAALNQSKAKPAQKEEAPRLAQKQGGYHTRSARVKTQHGLVINRMWPQHVLEYVVSRVTSPNVFLSDVVDELKSKYGVRKIEVASLYDFCSRNRQALGFSDKHLPRRFNPRGYSTYVATRSDTQLKPMRGWLDRSQLEFILSKYPSVKDDELAKQFEQKFGRKISTSTIYNMAKKNNIARSAEYKKEMHARRIASLNASAEKLNLPPTKICANCNRVIRKTEYRGGNIGAHAWRIIKYCPACFGVVGPRNIALRRAEKATSVWTPQRESTGSSATVQVTRPSVVELPRLARVDVDQVIVESVIKNTIRRNAEMTYLNTGYAFGIDSVRDWMDFIGDFMARSGRISEYFNVPNKFVKTSNHGIKYGN